MNTTAVILLVEGARPASSLVPALKDKGYEVLRASNSKEALSQARTHGPALAVVKVCRPRGVHVRQSRGVYRL